MISEATMRCTDIFTFSSTSARNAAKQRVLKAPSKARNRATTYDHDAWEFPAWQFHSKAFDDK